MSVLFSRRTSSWKHCKDGSLEAVANVRPEVIGSEVRTP